MKLNQLATRLVKQADITALLALCQNIARQAGIESFDGLSLVEWYHGERIRILRSVLTDLEDLNPALTAILQQRIDEAEAVVP